MQLTPQILEACYNFLKTCPPFKSWKLPDSSEIKFNITRSNTTVGCFYEHAERMTLHIDVSDKIVGHTDRVVETMAHEIIHLYQHINKRYNANVEHNADFHKLAKRVCKHHGYDDKGFI